MFVFSYDGLPDLARHRGTIARLLREHSPPVFLAERTNLIERYDRLVRSLETAWPAHVVAYSFKTNYLVAESKLLQTRGAWSEVVSDREYRMARALGAPGDRIVFNGPWKSDDVLRLAFAEGAIVNVNDHGELTRVMRLVDGAATPQRIGVRLRSKMKGLGRSRFGFSIEDGEARKAVERIAASPDLRLAGTHCHLPGDTDDPERYREATANVAAFLRERVPSYEETIEYVDMGGSFPSMRPKPYARRSWDPRPIEEYIDAIAAALAPAFPKRTPRLIVEPGRYLVGDAFLFVSEVIDRRDAPGRQVVLSNASISMIPLTHYSPQAIRAFTADLEEKTDHATETTIFGASCREDDLLFRGPFPAVEVGDMLIHYAVGAYNSSLGPAFIFEPPATVFFE